MSRDNPVYAWRPTPELAAQFEEYRAIEQRGSANEALSVLVSAQLEQWRLSKLPRNRRSS